MSVDKISSSSGQPVDNTRSADAAGASEEKKADSNFDRVMDRKDQHEGQDKPPAEERKPGKTDRRKETQKDLSDKDLSAFISMRSRTLERPSASAGPAPMGKALPKKVIDEVVQAVRVGVNRAGDKEVQLDLKSNVLEGLRIKVSVHDNKVMTVLEVSSYSVKNTLETHMSELRQALEQKGITMAQVDIQFKETPRQQQDSSSRDQQQHQSPDEDTEDDLEI